MKIKPSFGVPMYELVKAENYPVYHFFTCVNDRDIKKLEGLI